MAKSQPLVHESDWKARAVWSDGEAYFRLETGDTGQVDVRLFLTRALLAEAEPALYRQIVHATRFPGVRLVVITPDVHYGYGVPVGCVILTDRGPGAAGVVAMGPVGFDIGCGMVLARSAVSFERATPDRKLEFNREVTKGVSLGAGGKSVRLGTLSEQDFQDLVRGGAERYVEKYGADFDRSRAERHRIPVSDQWDIPWGGKGSPERGLDQLGSLGGGNHFIELQHCEDTGTLCVQVHTGSRGFGHGLATNYFELAKEERAERGEAGIADIDLGYFTPDSRHFEAYLNAVAAAGNYAILNRLVIFEQIADAFRKVFREDLELVYEISHNLVQAEDHPAYGPVWVHRKGATRAFPGGHPALAGTIWRDTGHPILIPGSNRDRSYVLMPEPGAVKSAYSVNHGAGRRMSRGEALRQLDQRKIDEQYRRDGILVNLDGRVPLDESAQCYKRSDEVVSAVVASGLARIQNTLWPLASIKGGEDGTTRVQGRERKEKDRSRQKNRDAERMVARRSKGQD
jgi:tRNA-splicing ligase RtcB (3'-phosphate/5'-hydroxy nucleic acid ligase)